MYELFPSWWSLPDTSAYFVSACSSPTRLDPPGCTGIKPLFDDAARSVQVVSGRFAFNDDIERCGERSLLIDVAFHSTHVLRHQRLIVGPLRNQTVVAQDALHRFLARPDPHDPDGDARRLHRRGE